jgi:hypothetical protein
MVIPPANTPIELTPVAVIPPELTTVAVEPVTKIACEPVDEIVPVAPLVTLVGALVNIVTPLDEIVPALEVKVTDDAFNAPPLPPVMVPAFVPEIELAEIAVPPEI